MEQNLPFTYALRLRLDGEAPFFGPGVLRLLRLVGQTGSLRSAAAAMGMSYSKAWKITKKAERELGFPLMDRRAGGPGGGGARLTQRCADFLERYERFVRETGRTADRLFDECFSGFSAERKE